MDNDLVAAGCNWILMLLEKNEKLLLDEIARK